MTITRTIIALTALIALAPSGVSAASLYGGGTASVNAAGITVGATASGTGSAVGGSADADVGIEAPDTPVSSDDRVMTDTDFESFRANLSARDANVAEVEAAGDSEVKVSYYHPGRLFGMFSVKVKSETRAMLDDEGTARVETHMPWWNFFVVGTDDTSTMVDEKLSSSAEVSTDLKMTDDAAARTRLIEAIVAAHASANAQLMAR